MKSLIYTILLGLPVALFAQQPNFTVKGTVAHFNSPAKAYLRYMVNGQNRIDSTLISDGKFEIEGTISEPERAVLFINSQGSGLYRTGDYLSLYIDKGTTFVSSGDSVKHAVVSGTKVSGENAKFNLLLEKIGTESAAIEKVVADASPAQAATNAFKSKIESMNELEEKNECTAYVRFIKENPSSMVSLAALSNYDYYADYKDVEPLFRSLTPDIQNSEAGKKYALRLAVLKAVRIGTMAPEFTSSNTAGQPVSLLSFRGKYVLLDFWASWCIPCRQENPNVLQAYNRFKNKNFTVFGYSLDRQSERSAWLKAIQTDGLAWTQVANLESTGNQVAQNEIAGMYGIRSIPSNFLIGPDGRIIAKNLRGKHLTDKLSQLLDRSSSK